jgi:cytochrome c oxidase subunit 2
VRRGTVFRLVAVGLAAGAAALAVALFVPWLPEPASREAGRIWFVFWFTAAICIGVFAIVAGVSVYSLLKFRVQPDDDSDGPPIHGHTGIEVAWTVGPAMLVTAIAIVSAVVLAQNDDPDSRPLRVEVTAQQFAWSFKYLDADELMSTTLRVPLEQPVELLITSRDVIHSFWVPEFAQKQDAVPGQTTRLIITPTRLGTFPVACAELCGLGHALMRSEAVVMTRAAYDRWLSGQRQAMGGTPKERGNRVFVNNGCGGCHTLADAGTKATVGPDLDNLPALARRARQPLEAFTRESIVRPDAYVEAGFAKGVMPKTFADLPEEQLDALVQYLVDATQRGS